MTRHQLHIGLIITIIFLILIAFSVPVLAGPKEDIDSLGPCKPRVIQLMLKYNLITEEQAEELR